VRGRVQEAVTAITAACLLRVLGAGALRLRGLHVRAVHVSGLRRYFNLSGAHALLATVNGPGVVAVYTLSELPPDKGIRACANLAGMVPPGEGRGATCALPHGASAQQSPTACVCHTSNTRPPPPRPQARRRCPRRTPWP
jgi:hypothetical protein